MNEYESVIIIAPNLGEKRVKEIISKATEKINQIAKVTKVENLGIKKLAYEVQHNKEGNYVVYEFETTAEGKEITDKIDKFYRTQEEIIKYITIKRG